MIYNKNSNENKLYTNPKKGNNYHNTIFTSNLTNSLCMIRVKVNNLDKKNRKEKTMIHTTCHNATK